MLSNWAYQKSPNPPKNPPRHHKLPRCLFSLSMLEASGVTSNNSAVAPSGSGPASGRFPPPPFAPESDVIQVFVAPRSPPS